VNPDSSIHLKLSPEVSTLDYSNAVTISGFTIPALSTRRSDTEVEIKDGESFIVSGLLDHRTTEIMSRMPGIASIPVLGQFFRSKNFNRSVVELVIIVTASVIDPLSHDPVPLSGLPKQVVSDLDAAAFDASTQGQPQPVEQQPMPDTGGHR
jgi:pilus assembly protein CpaC